MLDHPITVETLIVILCCPPVEVSQRLVHVMFLLRRYNENIVRMLYSRLFAICVGNCKEIC